MRWKHPLLPVLISYIGGLVFRHSGGEVAVGWAVAMAGLLAVVAGIVCYRTRNPDALLLWLCFLTGFGVMHQNLAGQAEKVDRTAKFAGGHLRVIKGYVEPAPMGASPEFFTVRDASVSSGTEVWRLPGRLQVYVGDDATSGLNRRLVAGDLIQFAGQLEGADGLRNFFGFNRVKWLRQKEVYLTAKVTPGQIRIIAGQPAGFLATLTDTGHVVRTSVAKAITRSMAPDEARLMIAMVFNDLSQLTDRDKIIFRESNTLHLFAVSGMHVAIFAGILHMLFRAFGAGVRVSWLATIVMLAAYLWMIDFVPSAVRAFLMVSAFSIGYLLKREVDTVTSILFSIAVIVGLDPFAPWQAGFLLSVAGVIGIVFFTPLIMLWIYGSAVPREKSLWWRSGYWLMNAIAVTLAVSCFMLPLQLYYFQYWNVLSFIANLLQGFLAAPVLACGLLIAAVDLFAPALLVPVGQSASGLMRLVYWISAVTAETDWGIIRVRAHTVVVPMLTYAVLLVGYYMSRVDTPEFRVKSRARFCVHASFCSALLCGLIVWTSSGQRELQLWFLDVGQGDATVIVTPDRRTFVVDGGRSEPDMGTMVVLPHLQALGIDQIDAIIATHPDDDHVGGLATLVDRFKVGRILVPEEAGTTLPEELRLLSRKSREKGVPMVTVRSGDNIRSGNLNMSIFNPPPADRNFLPGDNDRSIIVRLSYGDFRALLMGDASSVVEERLVTSGRIEDVDVLKAGHHGSRHSSSLEFLAAAKPEAAILSAGKRNVYGHPHPDVMSRLEAAGAVAFRTDDAGAVLISTDGKGFTVDRP